MNARDSEIGLLYRDDGLTLGQIAERYGVTRERVRQILARDGIELGESGRRNRFMRRVTVTESGCWTVEMGNDPTKANRTRRAALTLFRGWRRGNANLTTKCGNAECVSPHHAIERTTPEAWREWLLGRVSKTESGCWEWMKSRLPSGYGHINIDGRTEYTHRLAWTLFRGPVHGGLHVLHRCDNPPCCNPEHLFVGTHSDNMRDKFAKGRGNLPRKLDSHDIKQIRFLAENGFCQAHLAHVMGTTPGYINSIVRGRARSEAA